MNTVVNPTPRVVSGMRPTGRLHLGHYHGVLKNWLELQQSYDCYFSVVDWHALTTHYDSPKALESYVHQMVIDWLAAGVNPSSATIFVQSKVPEHAELHLLLSMATPLGWLERVPTYKEQQEKLSHKDLSTYGFLGYPLLQAADILIYRSEMVPVGEDQVPHIEFAREVARRFNHLYGKDKDFVEKSELSIKKMGKKLAKLYASLRKVYLETGEEEALLRGQALVEEQANLATEEKKRLLGYLEGTGKRILAEPQSLLTKAAKFPGLDGQKMSKSYDNTIGMREEQDVTVQKIRTMQTDPARVRLTDPGDPEKCPVWSFHELYSDNETKKWVVEGCKTAGIGCVACKKPVIDAVLAEQASFNELARPYEEDPALVKTIIHEGSERARDVARDTMEEVRRVMGLQYK